MTPAFRSTRPSSRRISANTRRGSCTNRSVRLRFGACTASLTASSQSKRHTDMATQPVQTYANHVHRPVLTGIVWLLAVLALAFFLTAMTRFRGPLIYGVLCLTGAVVVLGMISRQYIIRLQDRIIRLEMQLRLERLGITFTFPRLS